MSWGTGVSALRCSCRAWATAPRPLSLSTHLVVQAVASASMDCIQQLLSRCELTATVRIGTGSEYLTLAEARF